MVPTLFGVAYGYCVRRWVIGLCCGKLAGYSWFAKLHFSAPLSLFVCDQHYTISGWCAHTRPHPTKTLFTD